MLLLPAAANCTMARCNCSTKELSFFVSYVQLLGLIFWILRLLGIREFFYSDSGVQAIIGAGPCILGVACIVQGLILASWKGELLEPARSAEITYWEAVGVATLLTGAADVVSGTSYSIWIVRRFQGDGIQDIVSIPNGLYWLSCVFWLGAGIVSWFFRTDWQFLYQTVVTMSMIFLSLDDRLLGLENEALYDFFAILLWLGSIIMLMTLLIQDMVTNLRRYSHPSPQRFGNGVAYSIP